MPASYLLPIADREPLAWILREQRTAFGDHRAREAQALDVGDVLFLYTTRGCFRNPTRDRGRIIGRALVKAPAKRVDVAPAFGGRAYPLVVELEIESLAPLREGLELAPLVPRLRGTFPDAATWSVRMRRALVPLDERDADAIERALVPHVRPYPEALSSYRPVGADRRRSTRGLTPWRVAILEPWRPATRSRPARGAERNVSGRTSPRRSSSRATSSTSTAASG